MIFEGIYSLYHSIYISCKNLCIYVNISQSQYSLEITTTLAQLITQVCKDSFTMGTPFIINISTGSNNFISQDSIIDFRWSVHAKTLATTYLCSSPCTPLESKSTFHEVFKTHSTHIKLGQNPSTCWVPPFSWYCYPQNGYLNLGKVDVP